MRHPQISFRGLSEFRCDGAFVDESYFTEPCVRCATRPLPSSRAILIPSESGAALNLSGHRVNYLLR
jgi:hypothetical protein